MAWEAPPELALLEVGDGVLAEGDVLSKEVVEVVVYEAVVDTTGVAKYG